MSDPVTVGIGRADRVRMTADMLDEYADAVLEQNDAEWIASRRQSSEELRRAAQEARDKVQALRRAICAEVTK